VSQSIENEQMRREALKLLAQVERQGLDIARAYQDGSDISGRFADFRRFVEKVEHFYVFIDLVEERLPRFEDRRRDALKRHLADIRWRIVIVEVDTTQIYLVRIGETSQPWPLGSRQFLQRRLDRLGEIDAWYDSFGEAYQLTPLSEAMVRAVRDLLTASIEKAPGLDDFTADAAAALDLVRADQIRVRIDRGSSRHASAAARPLPKAPAPPFRVREVDGRFYAERDGIVAVSEACRVAQMSLDDLARRMGTSRPTLVLLLNGSDPLQRATVDELRKFVSQHGGTSA
jgi:hypothetical protein